MLKCKHCKQLVICPPNVTKRGRSVTLYPGDGAGECGAVCGALDTEAAMVAVLGEREYTRCWCLQSAPDTRSAPVSCHVSRVTCLL